MTSATAGKTSYSVLACGSASGALMPPYTVYKGKHLYSQWTQGGPKGAGYGCSQSGWMHDFNFISWFKTMFVKAVAKEEKPLLLLFDGHNSHISYDLIEMAKSHGIILFCLPPHTSHRLQPLDVGFFAPFKTVWRSQLKDWARMTNHMAVTKPVFPALLKQAWERATTSSLVGGFKGWL